MIYRCLEFNNKMSENNKQEKEHDFSDGNLLKARHH